LWTTVEDRWTIPTVPDWSDALSSPIHSTYYFCYPIHDKGREIGTVKFRAERDGFLEALSTASRAATARGASAMGSPTIHLALSGRRLDVAGSDGDLLIESWIEVAGEADGSTFVPARLVVEIVRSFEPGLVDVVADDDEVRISAGHADFNIRIPASAELVRPGSPDVKGIELPAEPFGEALRQVVRAALSDDSRAPQLTGVLMVARADGLRLVATDSYRLAFRDLAGVSALEEGESVLVPARALSEVQRLAGGAGGSTGEDGRPKLVFSHTDLDAAFELGAVRLTTRLLKGVFPEYERLVPEHYTNRAHIAREELATALRRVRLLVRDVKDVTTPVRVAFDADGLELTVLTPESGRAVERVQARHEGDDVTVAFNPTYLLDGIDAIRSETVVLEVIDSGKPAMLQGEDDDTYRYLLMPVRVS
jgi:DNA polymerase-3 subunit beta